MDPSIVSDFARLRVLQQPAAQQAATVEEDMETLAKDINTALDESSSANPKEALTHDGGDTSAPAPQIPKPAGTPSSRRRAWRRRCKSTSNLSSLATGSPAGAAGADAAGGRQQQMTDESSTTSEDERHTQVASGSTGGSRGYSMLPRIGGGGGDRGTSSLQLTDSDEEEWVSTNRGAQRTPSMRAKDMKKKRGGGGSDQGNSEFLSTRKQLPIESDSVTENFSPSVRPSTKRKRKFKRMALDPEPGGVPGKFLPGSYVNKRQRTRQRSDCGGPTTKQRQLSGPPPSTSASFGITVGKRKRSNREKSVEPENLIKPNSRHFHFQDDGHRRKTNEEHMDMDEDDEDRRSSSSLSSTEWDADSDNPESLSNSREADDEQSDWPGYEKSAASATGGAGGAGGGGRAGASAFNDDDEDLSALFLGEAALPMTATAHKAYLARMKRLAECVPGREIRAGARRVRARQTAFTIKSSSSEQLSRFLRDPTRSEIRLTVLRAPDRDKVVQMANLYSLSVRLEGANLIVLSKTSGTVRLKEFAVPVAAPAKPPVDFKRRRRTPPNSPDVLDVCSANSEQVELIPSPLAASSDVSMQPSPEWLAPEEVEEGGAGRPSPVPPYQNRSESPVMGASEPKVDKSKISGSLSS